MFSGFVKPGSRFNPNMQIHPLFYLWRVGGCLKNYGIIGGLGMWRSVTFQITAERFSQKAAKHICSGTNKRGRGMRHRSGEWLQQAEAGEMAWEWDR